MKKQVSVDTEKYIAVNNHILPNTSFVAFSLLLVSFGLWADEKIFTVFGVLIALVFIAVLLISPTHYIFSNENVVIYHPFKRKEIICWKDIRSINEYGSWSYPGLLNFPHYKIYYRHEKEQIFLNGEICKSKKTKWLLEKYYKGNVE